MSVTPAYPFRPPLFAALTLALACLGAQAQSTPPAPAAEPEPDKAAVVPPSQLPVVKVKADPVPVATPGRITSTTKGSTRPLENPQSITVLTRERLDQAQVKTLVEALGSVAGVVAGERGNRGFDDFGIRGAEVGNNQEKYIDGLDTVRSGYIPSEEIFGAERIEILKGSASLLFGRVRPGGLINIVSKRPVAEAFGQFGVTVGNLGLREVTADFGRPLSDDGRAAFRVAALASDSDDATDFIWFRNRYIAPSLKLDLGANTDFTLITSYQDRAWVRNQALPAKGTVLPNPNGPVRRSLYVGEPGFGHNDAQRLRVGYALEHRLESGITVTQNFRWEDSKMTQNNSAFLGRLGADNRTQARTGNVQLDTYRGVALDTYASVRLASPLGTHDLTAGLDVADKGGRLRTANCTMPAIDIYNPVYGAAVSCGGSPADNTQDIRGLGVYARDRLHVGEKLHYTYGLRHDRVTTRTTNHLTGAINEPTDTETTGMFGAVYEVAPGMAPYASVANSFLPVSGVDRNGATFEPEAGRQVEAGMKFERDDGRQVASVALYDLRRTNVLTPDPANTAFSVQTGEQRVKGLELELAADLQDGFNVNAAYAYSDAVVTRSNTASQVGRTVNNVPRHSANAWVMYRETTGERAGWGAGLGLRGVSQRTGYSYDFTIPGYVVLDAAVNYQGRGWRAALNVRNLSDKTIYGGSFSNDLVTLGETRQLRLNLTYEL